MTPQTDHPAALRRDAASHARLPWDHSGHGRSVTADEPPAWRSGVSLSDDVRLRQQWSADVEPLLVAQ